MGHLAKARYLGGHPAATQPMKRSVVRVDDDALRIEVPALVIPYDSIVGARMEEPEQQGPQEFRFSLAAGLIGGVKQNQTAMERDVFLRAMRAVLVISVRDRHGDLHDVRFDKLDFQGRTRKEKRADFKVHDYRGGERLVREIIAARFRANDASPPA